MFNMNENDKKIILGKRDWLDLAATMYLYSKKKEYLDCDYAKISFNSKLGYLMRNNELIGKMFLEGRGS